MFLFKNHPLRYVPSTLLFITFFYSEIHCQSIIFQESMGSVGSTTTLQNHILANGFDNNHYAFSKGGLENVVDIRATSASTGYTGASGNANCWFTESAGDYGFEIAGINASGYTSLSLSFAVRKQGATGNAFADFSIDYWNGSSYKTLSITGWPSISDGAGWYFISGISLPTDASITELKLRFKKSGTVSCRLDDIALQGIFVGCVEPTFQTSSLSFNTVANSAMNLNWTRGNGDGGVLVITRAGTSVNLDPENGVLYTANKEFGLGSEIGTGNFVVYKGTGNTLALSGLFSGTSYHFALYEFNELNQCYQLNELTANQKTTGSFVTDYFRSKVSGSWNALGTWESSADNVYWSQASLIPSDNAQGIVIQENHTVTITSNITMSSLNIANNASLIFDGIVSRSVQVQGDVFIEGPFGQFITQASGAVENELILKGNLTNNGIFDMSRGGSTLVCNVTFNRNGDQLVEGSGSLTRFNYLIVDLGTSRLNTLEIMSDNFSTRDHFLHFSSNSPNNLKNGTLKLSGTYPMSHNLFYPSKLHDIPVNAGIWFNNPTVNIPATDDSWDVYGLFRISAGKVNIGLNSGNSLRYHGSLSEIIIDGGELFIAGRFGPYSPGSDYTNYTQHGGKVILVTEGSNSTTVGAFDMSREESHFTMSGGKIVLRNHTGVDPLHGDFYIPLVENVISGGRIQFGDDLSLDSQHFMLNSAIPIPTVFLSNENGTINKPKVMLVHMLEVVYTLIISEGTLLDVSSDGGLTNFDLRLGGDLICEGDFEAREGSFILNGNTQQTLTGNPIGCFDFVVVNTSAEGVRVYTSVQIQGSLILSDGLLHTNSTNSLILLNGSSSTSGSDESFVCGPMIKVGNSDFVFPIGNDLRWRRLGISNLSGVEAFTAEYYYTPYSIFDSFKEEVLPLQKISNLEYWNLSRSGNEYAKVSLYWENAASSGIEDCSDLRLAHFNSEEGYWEKTNGEGFEISGLCSGNNNGIIRTQDVVTSFSPFTFGSISTNNPLPIELFFIGATLKEDFVELEWKMASEYQLNYFWIEKSVDGVRFEPIGKVVARGDTQDLTEYNFLDKVLNEGIIYYRIVLVNNDGFQEFSDIVQVVVTTNKKYPFTIYPNPLTENDNLTVRIGESIYKKAQSIGLKNLAGEELFFEKLNVDPVCSESVIYFPNQLAKGTYFVIIETLDGIYQEKLVVQ
jgi:hypothetical protein